MNKHGLSREQAHILQGELLVQAVNLSPGKVGDHLVVILAEALTLENTPLRV